MKSQKPSGLRSSSDRVPHPLIAGGAWMFVMLVIGSVYLTFQLAYRDWSLGAEEIASLGRDQLWSLVALIVGGFAFGFTMATVRRWRSSIV